MFPASWILFKPDSHSERFFLPGVETVTEVHGTTCDLQYMSTVDCCLADKGRGGGLES